MAKGYWVVQVDITDMERFKKYVETNGEAFSKYGARFLVRGGQFSAMEGQCRSRHVVLEFPSYEAALNCWNSPEYQAALKHRLQASEIDLIVLEGYDGPQPAAI